MKIGLLDIDLTGPSIPRMLGLDGMSVHQSDDGWVPVYLPTPDPSSSTSTRSFDGTEREGQEGKAEAQGSSSTDTKSNNGNTRAKDEFKVMSIGFLLKDSRQAVVWRGPKKSAMIRQFLADVRWGDLDWLVVDTPPGEWKRLISSNFPFFRVVVGRECFSASHRSQSCIAHLALSQTLSETRLSLFPSPRIHIIKVSCSDICFAFVFQEPPTNTFLSSKTSYRLYKPPPPQRSTPY